MKSDHNLNLDTRADLGYGRSSDKLHKPRQRAGSFPYTDPDQLDKMDIDQDEEILDLDSLVDLMKKMPDAGYKITDPYAGNGVDHFYFAGGNTKLSDCFHYPDSILIEVEATGRSITPVPGLHKGKNVMRSTQAGSAKYIKNTSLNRIGDLRGWSKAPRPIIDDADESEDHPNTLKDLIDLMAKEE